jgi:hypothetical protein
MPTVQEIVRAKNVDILVHQYNNDTRKINNAGFLNKDSKDVKRLKNTYENLIARFDTDKNTVKKDGKYIYGVALDSKIIEGLKGISPSLKIRVK